MWGSSLVVSDSLERQGKRVAVVNGRTRSVKARGKLKVATVGNRFLQQNTRTKSGREYIVLLKRAGQTELERLSFDKLRVRNLFNEGSRSLRNLEREPCSW